MSEECFHEWIDTEWLMTCHICGQVSDHNHKYIPEARYYNINYESVYHKSVYIKEKLDFLNCNNFVRTESYIIMLNNLKNKHFETIFDLNRLLKSLKLNKFYKYIYQIYHDLTGKKLINLTVSNIHLLINQFKNLEGNMKIESIKSTNIPINIIIYVLMKHNKIHGYEFLILPKNKNKIKIIERLLKDY